MSGGIKYRLSPRERSLVAESLGALDPVRARTQGRGVDVKLHDPELEVSVEEQGQEILYELSYPFDNDHVSSNGRLYLKDSFRLDRQDGKILQFERAASQQGRANEKSRFWVEMARRDHPHEKITRHPEHLKKFLRDLSDLPPPQESSASWQALVNQTLPALHRPFPPDSRALVDANFAVFAPVRDQLLELGFKLKFGDPQSGLTLRREGDKFLLGLQLVLDNDAESGLDAESNGRLYLQDTYEIDALSGKVLSATREFTPSPVPKPAFDQALQRLKRLGPLDPGLPELEQLCAGWLKGLGAFRKEAPNPEAEFEEPQDKFGKALWRLHRLSGEETYGPDLPIPLRLPSDPELRHNLHRALTLILSGDQAALEAESKAWETHPLLNALLHLSRQETDAAQRALSGLEPGDELGHRVQELIALQGRAQRLAEGFPLLELALQERVQGLIQEDQAWNRGLARAWKGDGPINPEMRKVAVEGFLRRLRNTLEAGSLGFTAGIAQIEGDGPFEKEIRALLRKDPNLLELTHSLDEADAELRQDALVHLARRRLSEAPNGLPATAYAIAERYAASDPKAAALRRWLSGHADFGQKFESALGHFTREVANPVTLGSMMLAGSAAKLGKLAFVRYFGNTSLRLKVGAELFSVGLEATAFVGSEKLYHSAFHSPVGLWEKSHRDLAGAMLAFGVLRGGGLAGKRFQGQLRDSAAWQTWLQGRTRLAWAEKPLQHALALGEAQGKGALWKKPLGQALSFPLRYAAETGLPRAWLKPTADFAAHHGLILASLMAANSLGRFVGLRPASPQGWKADLVDDALLYGHFHVAGRLLQRLGPNRLDFHLAALEGGAAHPGIRKSAQASKTPSEAGPAKAPLSFKIPPSLRNFGSEVSSRLAQAWRGLRRGPGAESEKPGANSFPFPRLDSLKTWLKTWSEGLAGLRWPWRTPKGVRLETAASPLLLPMGSERLAIPAGRSETLPAPPPIAAPSEVFLQARPQEVPFRFLPSQAKVHMAVSLTGRPEDRAVLPVSRNTLHYESVLGREEVQLQPAAVGIDLGFPSTARGVEPRHARIHYQVKLRLTTFRDEIGQDLTLGIPEKTTVTLESLAQSAPTFVNGKRVQSSPLQNGDRIQLGEAGPELIFHQPSPDVAPSFTRPAILLPASQTLWSFGRESAKNGSPDIPFPVSSRDISARQGRILRDAEGNYFIQDQGRNPVLVNGQAVYGSRRLQDGDSIRFGEQNEFVFRAPPTALSTEPPRAPQPHPRAEIPEPKQAERHPMFRGMSESEIQQYFQRLAESDSLPLDQVRAATLTAPDGRPLVLMTQYTGWAVGGAASNSRTSRLQFRESQQAEANPFQIYLDSAGEFILKPLTPESNVAVQGRPDIFWAKGSPDPLGPLQKVEGWTRLRGGERIFSGEGLYFDFWKFAPPLPEPTLPRRQAEAHSSDAKPSTGPSVSVPAASRLLAPGKAMPLPVKSEMVLKNQAKTTKVEMLREGEKLSVLIPEDVGKIANIRVFREGDTWKIHSEGEGETPLLVNGIPLPPNIPLPLAPQSELSLGSLRFTVEFP